MAKRKNTLLADPGAKIEYTEDMIQELHKCKKDVLYFANHYCYIVHPTEGKIKLTLRDYQEGFIKSIAEHRSVVNLQIRQSGKCIFYNTKVEIKRRNNIKTSTSITIKEFFDMV